MKEVQIVGSRCGPMDSAVRLLAARVLNGSSDLSSVPLLDPSWLTDQVYPLSSALAAFEHAKRPGALKIVLNPSRPTDSS